MKLLQGRNREDPEINLISLIDVVLMLVIFFMLSSQFVTEGRVRIRLPQASSVPSSKPDTGALIVTITQQGSYRVNERELINSSPETLRAALIKIAGSDRTARVTVRADARATHQAVITAMDVLGRLGFAEINVATVKDEEPGKP
jgi:biopolymer transport protein ExbD